MELVCSTDKPNNSVTFGFVWQEFDFQMCAGFTVSRYTWAVCTLLCFALGFPPSVYILWELLKSHRGGRHFTPNDFFVLNLSLMDAFFLGMIPPGLFNHFTWQSWAFEAIWNMFYALSTIGRPFLMACSCLDCYLAVVHPIAYHNKKSLTPRVVVVCFVWVCTLFCGILYFLFYTLYYSLFSILPFAMAIALIGICDSLILRALVKSDPGRKSIHPQKQRAIHTLINSLVMTVLSYLPPILLIGIGKYSYSSCRVYICAVAIPITVTSALGSAVMPILHLNNAGKFDKLWLRLNGKS